MIALSGDALVGAAALVLVAVIGFGGIVWQSRKTRKELSTSNGHSAGEGISKVESAVGRLEHFADRVEQRQIRVETQIDRIEVRVSEQSDLVANTAGRVSDVTDKLDAHLTEVAPLAAWARESIASEREEP